MIQEGKCCDTAAAAAAGTVAGSRGTNPGQLCSVPASLGLFAATWALWQLAAPFKCFEKTQFQVLCGEKLNFLPFFLNVPNAMIFISRTYSEEKMPRVAYPLPIQLSMDICI